MPEKSLTIDAQDRDSFTLTALAYGALEKLSWSLKYAGENTLIALTPGNWHDTGEEITVHCGDNSERTN